jgi:hypothetical protein
MRKLSLILVAPGLILAGCTTSHLSPNFGVALRQDLAAQIADPDAHYKGTPAPGGIGQHAAASVARYDAGTVIQPVATSTSKVGSNNNGAPAPTPTPAAPASSGP